MAAPRISVIIPAFNAGSTIAATLGSVLAQTRQDLEVIVVDDGSADDTSEIVGAIAASDNRVRLERQANLGVAAARNRAIDLASGEFIAPLDADDLWHPAKLETQLKRFDAGGADLGLVYSWYRLINEKGSVLKPGSQPVIEGRVLHRHLEWNFVQNGSAPLIRASALAGLRYAPELQRDGAPGCEDYLLQLRIATQWEFGCAPGFLIGYRRSAGAMSADRSRMLRSHIAMYRMLQPTLTGSARALCRRMLVDYQVRLSRNRAGAGRLDEAGKTMGEALRSEPATALAFAAARYAGLPALAARRFGATLPRGAAPGPAFLAMDPLEGAGPGQAPRPSRRARALDARL